MIEATVIRTHAGQPPVAILGVPFDNLTGEEAGELIGRMVASRRPHYLVSANVGFLVRAQKDPELRRVLFEASLVVGDGASLVHASRWLGHPPPDRALGSDLVPLLLKMAVAKGLRVFLLGEVPEATNRAAAALQKLYPGLALVGSSSLPRVPPEEGNEAGFMRSIAAAGPDLLLVALGCPRQEQWIHAHYRSLGVPVSVGVGPTDAFPAGVARRAPDWLSAGTVRDLCAFGAGIAKQWWQLQFHSPKIRLQVSTPVQAAETWQCIKLPPRLDLQATRDDALLVDQVLADGRECLLDLSAVEFIDSTGMGLLIRLQKKIRASGRQLVLLAPSANVRRALALMQLQMFFASAPDIAAAQVLIQINRRATSAPFGSAAGRSLPWPEEVTAANVGKVWEQTEAHIGQMTAAGQDVVIDLSTVRLVDRAGAELMVRARKFALRDGCRLTFIAPTRAVLGVLRRARLEEFVLGSGALTRT